MRIGMFDSGIGGLTLLQKAMEYLPDEEFIFYADTEHVPYGSKTKEQIIGYSEAAVRFLTGQGCDAIVIACNTATSVAAAQLRERYSLPIIGIEPAVKPAVASSRHKRVLVMATPVTVREKKLKDLVDRVDEEHLVDMVAMPQFVQFAEKGIFDGEEVRGYIQAQMEALETELYSVVVLGCTHFNHFKNILKEYFPEDCDIIDGSDGTVRNLVHIVRENGYPSAGRGSVSFYQTGRRVTDGETLEFYGRVMHHLEEA